MVAVGLAAVGAWAIGPVGTASAAPLATSGPTVKLAQPTFGSYEGDYDAISGFNYWSAAFTFHWTVSAPAGVCAQTLTYANYDTLGGPIDPILGQDSETFAVAKAARSYVTGLDAMSYYRGGYGVVIRVTDCRGVTVASKPVYAVVSPSEDTDSRLKYSAGWSVSHCTCFSTGTTHQTSARNASVTFRTVRPVDASGVRLALVMAKAPNRGSADIYVDGVKKATVNTYSPTSVNRALVYQTLLRGTAKHTVKVVNLATVGHPRIDVDAIINGG